MAPQARRLAPRNGSPRAADAGASVVNLDAFYRSIFLPLVRRVTWKHGLSKEDARDIVQDAFVLAITKIDLSGKPKAWLIQVVDHLAVNHSRKRARRAQLISKWIPAQQEADLSTEDGESGVDH